MIPEHPELLALLPAPIADTYDPLRNDGLRHLFRLCMAEEVLNTLATYDWKQPVRDAEAQMQVELEQARLRAERIPAVQREVDRLEWRLKPAGLQQNRAYWREYHLVRVCRATTRWLDYLTAYDAFVQSLEKEFA